MQPLGRRGRRGRHELRDARPGADHESLAASAYLARRGSTRARLASLGVLIYLVCSYLLYAFFVHFGPLFPVYLAVLSLSLYLLLDALLTADPERVAGAFSERTPVALTSG